MTFKEWISKHLGKYVRYNKTTKGYQCVDLVKSYLVEVFDFYKEYPSLEKAWAWGDARQWYEYFSSRKPLTENFRRLANTPTFVPIEGDICVFTEHNDEGHICIAYNNNSTTSKIYTIDQNFPKGSKVKYCVHRYTTEGFLGVLRPYRYVKADANIRNKPSMSGKILGELKAGKRVFIHDLDSSKKWARIGKDTWISYKFIKEL